MLAAVASPSQALADRPAGGTVVDAAAGVNPIHLVRQRHRAGRSCWACGREMVRRRLGDLVSAPPARGDRGMRCARDGQTGFAVTGEGGTARPDLGSLVAYSGDRRSDENGLCREVWTRNQRSGGARWPGLADHAAARDETAPLQASMRRAVEHRASDGHRHRTISAFATPETIAVGTLDRGWTMSRQAHSRRAAKKKMRLPRQRYRGVGILQSRRTISRDGDLPPQRDHVSHGACSRRGFGRRGRRRHR